MPKLDVSVVTVERDGIDVEVDVAFARTWKGVVLAADMQSERLGETQRFVAMVEYYRCICPNIDDVDAALSERNGGAVEVGDLMQFVAEAVREATPKN